MTIRQLALYGTGILLVATLLFLLSGQDGAAKDTLKDAKPVTVPVFVVQFQKALQIRSPWPGTVQARRQSALGFERGGLIASIKVDVGDQVIEGQLLASLNTVTQHADLAAARAGAKQAIASHKIAAATLKRQQALVSSGHISAQRVEEFSAKLLGAEAALQVAEAQVTALQSRLMLSHIRAPFDGIITARLLDEGAIAGPGTALLQLVESGSLEIAVGLPAGKAQALMPDQTVQVRFGDKTTMAKLRKSTNVINPATQNVRAVFDLLPGDNNPVAGQSVELLIDSEIDAKGFEVPLSALREGKRGLWSLYQLVADDTGSYVLNASPVEVLYANEKNAYVRGPLPENAIILRAASHVTTRGMRVVPAKVQNDE